jgi:hypothetical protein
VRVEAVGGVVEARALEVHGRAAELGARMPGGLGAKLLGLVESRLAAAQLGEAQDGLVRHPSRGLLQHGRGAFELGLGARPVASVHQYGGIVRATDPEHAADSVAARRCRRGLAPLAGAPMVVDVFAGEDQVAADRSGDVAPDHLA